MPPCTIAGSIHRLNSRLSITAQAAIWDRMKIALSGGSSPRSSRTSADPTKAIAAATGVGKISAADSSSGKLRLNGIDTFVGTGMSSVTATAPAHTSGAHPYATNCSGSVNACHSSQARIGTDTASS